MHKWSKVSFIICTKFRAGCKHNVKTRNLVKTVDEYLLYLYYDNSALSLSRSCIFPLLQNFLRNFIAIGIAITIAKYPLNLIPENVLGIFLS